MFAKRKSFTGLPGRELFIYMRNLLLVHSSIYDFYDLIDGLGNWGSLASDVEIYATKLLHLIISFIVHRCRCTNKK